MDNAMISAIINRFKEPSTFAGLASIAALAGVTDVQFSGWVAAVTGGAAFISGFLAIILPEKKG